MDVEFHQVRLLHTSKVAYKVVQMLDKGWKNWLLHRTVFCDLDNSVSWHQIRSGQLFKFGVTFNKYLVERTDPILHDILPSYNKKWRRYQSICRSRNKRGEMLATAFLIISNEFCLVSVRWAEHLHALSEFHSDWLLISVSYAPDWGRNCEFRLLG